jgi:hypothetical protein
MLEYFIDILIDLALNPVGLLGGLLGGLGGGLMRGGGGGGLLGGLMGNRQGGGGGGGTGPSPGPSRAPTTSAVEQEPQEQARQTQAQQQPVRAEQQPQEKPMATQVAEQVQEGSQATIPEKVEQQSPIKGLLDETKPSAEAPDTKKGEGITPPDVINRTDDETPVARPADEVTGEVPRPEAPDGVENQLFDAVTNEQPFEFQSGLPDRDLSGTLGDSEFTAPQGYSYKQTTTVQGGLPARRYGVRV